MSKQKILKVSKAEFELSNGASVKFDLVSGYVYVNEHECYQRIIVNKTKLPSYINAIWFYKNYLPYKIDNL